MKRTTLFALLLLVAAPIAAQELDLTPTGITSMQIDIGAQPVDLDVNSSKFTEYRDVPDGAFLSYVRLFGDETWKYDIIAEDAMEEDARYRVALSNAWMRLNIDYNQIPHNFGNEARTIFDRSANDRWAVSDSIQLRYQTALEKQFATNKAGINFTFLKNLVAPDLSTPNIIDIGLQRNRGQIEVALGPNAPYDVRFTYFQENRSGTRQAGTSFGFSNVTEAPEPVEYKTRDIGAAAEVPLGNGLVRGSIHYNQFENAIDSLIFENPFRLTDATDPSAYSSPGSGSIGGSATALIDLPADNKALSGSLGFMYKLPAKSRVTADVTLSKWTQNDRFDAYTTNTSVHDPFDATNVNNLPVDSLEGEMNIVAGNVAFNSRPMPNLTFNARYNLYDMNNDTPRIEFPGYVRFDAVWEEIPRINVPYGYKRDNADVSVAYDFRIVTLEGGYRLERYDREFRETRKTDEGTWRVAADVKPLDWALFRASYEIGNRDFDEYDVARGGGASFVHPEEPNNLPGLRRYDQANRDIDRLNALVQLTPFGAFGITLNYLTTTEDYDEDSDFGLLESKNDSYTAEFDYTPGERWNVYGYYTNESISSFQRGRQSGATPSTDPRADWTAQVDDEVDSFGGGANFAIMPNRLDVKVFGRQQTVDGNNDLESPPGGTPDVAFDIIEFDDTDLLTLSAELEYRLSQTWNVAVGAWHEKYEVRDAQTVGVTNYMPGSFLLAPLDNDYEGNVAYIRASYRR